ITLAKAARRHLAHPLHRVAEERNGSLATEGLDFRPRLEQSGFVVGGHYGDEPRATCAEFLAQPGDLQLSRRVHRKEPPPLWKMARGCFQHAGMFDGGNPHLGLRWQRPGKMVK